MITRILLVSTSLLNIFFTMSICLLITQPSFLNLIIKQDCAEDEVKCILLSVSTMIGSLGYSSSVFYASVSSYWEDILISIAVFFLLMMVSNMAMLVYSTIYFSTKYYPYVAWPWLIFSCPTMLLLSSILVFLMVDLNDTTRVTMELQSGGEGMFAMTLSSLLGITLYQVLSVLVVVIHLVREVNHLQSKEPVLILRGFYSGRTFPQASSTPARERRTTWGRDLAGPVRVEIQDDSREVEFCAPAVTPSVVSFPGNHNMMVSQIERNENQLKTSEDFKSRTVHNGMDMDGTLERVEYPSEVEMEMEESEYLVGLEKTLALEMLDRTDISEEVGSTKTGEENERGNEEDGLKGADPSFAVEKGSGESQLQTREDSGALERVYDSTGLGDRLIKLESGAGMEENYGEVFLDIAQPLLGIEEELLIEQESGVDILVGDNYKQQEDAAPEDTENILFEMDFADDEDDIINHDETPSRGSVGMLSLPADTIILLPNDLPDVSIGSGFD